MNSHDVYLGRRVGEAGPEGLELLAAGKVRDIYRIDEERLLFVTTDRISAFDVVMSQGIPHKGSVLTSIAAWWFAQTQDVIPNHLISADVDDVPGLDESWRDRLRGRVMLVHKAAPTSVEWVVRGYIAGSGWKEYQKSQTVCGIDLPSGLQLCSRLAAPLLTPTTKEEVHDRPISPEEAKKMVGPETFEQARRASMELFGRGTEVLGRLGILLADTKFEFGLRDGKLLLIDEALTPDSSRFWPAADYEPGRNQNSLDKQILRDHLETLDWDKNPPPPRLSEEVLRKVGDGYLEICERITGGLPAKVSR